MKKFLKLKNVLTLLCISVLVLSCSDDDDGDVARPEENVVELASADANLSSLVAALQAADGDLPSVLQGDGPFTVLAPTNAAFDAYLDGRQLGDIPTDELAQVLLNHVISDEITSRELINAVSGYASSNADGPTAGTKLSLYFNTDSGLTFNGQADVTQGGADIIASNGTIHVVDAVITLPTIVTFATADSQLDTLESVLTTDIINTLGTANGTAPAPFTVFGPTNEAFAQLSEAPTGDALVSVLLHHVIAGNNIVSSDLSDGLESPVTLEGDILIFSEDGNSFSITDGSGNEGIDISFVNIQATNGVIHIIDGVLIPDSGN
ncbi:fasciclin domain-containing protein [Spongiimicrobium sp. 2-473A-2-J]|uniref:fasciclin domain-containing protein n=2 Tax=Eudoraea algarum TaxID=3417568 RepID=UPI003D35A875